MGYQDQFLLSTITKPIGHKLKLALALLLIGIVAVAAGVSWYIYTLQTGIPLSDCNDPDSINSHVYNPQRLDTVRSCLTVSGIVDGGPYEEPDGDYHVNLRVDTQYQNLINNASIQYQSGDLVVEIICAHLVNGLQPVSACQNYNNTIPLPSLHQHITVSGPYVLDTAHYNWAEIHPVYKLTFS